MRRGGSPLDVSLISNCYELKEIAVEPSQLLVDPNNPRIAMDVDTDRKFTPNDVVKPDVQRFILSVINKNSYHIAELIHGIRTFGFIYTGDDMIVKRFRRRTRGTDSFLVIEGNRRTAAIRHLLDSPGLLSTAVVRTLKSLRVKEFIYVPSDEFTEDAVIDILLGKIHINGRLPWGALERAHYIYKSYLRESESHVGHLNFEYLLACAKEVAVFFSLKVGEIRKNLMVYRVYDQLKGQGFAVKPDHFSLIEMAVINRGLRKNYFELDGKTFNFSQTGLSRFDSLCIARDRQIKNPPDFRTFAKVFRESRTDVELIESGSRTLAHVADLLDRRQRRNAFLGQLQEIKTQLDTLEPASFRGVRAEVELIKEIRRIVEKKLSRLTR